jgi:hypothetical protein
MLKEKKITYEGIADILISNHFYPDREVLFEKKKDKVVGLQVKVPIPIRANGIVDRLKEILEGLDVSVNYLPNKQYVSIVLK